MPWTYQIAAAPKPRVLARVAHLFDQQLLTISALALTQNDEAVAITVTVAAETPLAHRLLAKLLHLQDVEQVHLTETKPSR
jgi:acetolactate synthase regulatory subunit